jgi:hypothetical protein
MRSDREGEGIRVLGRVVTQLPDSAAVCRWSSRGR